MYISAKLQAAGDRGGICHLQFSPVAAWSIPVTVTMLQALEWVLLTMIAVTVIASLDRTGVQVSATGLGLEVFGATATACLTVRLVGAGGLTGLRTMRAAWQVIPASVLAGALFLAACLALQGAPLPVVAAWTAAWAAATMVMLTASRLLAVWIINRLGAAGRLANKIAVLGDGPAAVSAALRLLDEDPTLFRLTGCYSMTESGSANARSGWPGRRGDLETMLLDCRLGGIDSVVVVPPQYDELSDEAPAPISLAEIGTVLRNYAVDLYMLPEDADRAGPDVCPAELGRLSVLLVAERPLKDWRGLVKTVFDRSCAALLLLMTAPTLALVAILIKLDSPGPVLFRQFRVGYNNQLFPIYKFRSMFSHEADALATRQTTRGDPRVTRVGRILRKLSIDELPQLFNVLLGTMSLVGPRPHAPGTSAVGQRVDTLIDIYPRRHLVRPGITGLAQVRGFRGGMVTYEHVARRVQCDLEYIGRQSLWLDLKIIYLTAAREIFGGRAF